MTERVQQLKLPIFLPDATYGSIRTLSFADLEKVGIEGIVTTTLHIEQKLGSEYVKDFSGIHKFFGWNKLILSDSGGWQVFSLINAALSKKRRGVALSLSKGTAPSIQKSGRRGWPCLPDRQASSPSGHGGKTNKITELGCTFVDPASGKTSLLTPESSQVVQFNLGADIVTVLDDPIIGNASLAERKESVRINTLWAKRSKDEFLKLHKLGEADFEETSLYLPPKRREDSALQTRSEQSNSSIDKSNKDLINEDKHYQAGLPLLLACLPAGRERGGGRSRPLLGAVIQGADDFKLRKKSAEELIDIGFDLYNFGGIPLYSEVSWKNEYPEGFYREMLAYVSELIPDEKLKYAMGVGQPDDIAFCVEHGWHMFDTVLPTRNARHGFLYVSQGQGDEKKGYKSSESNNSYLYDVMHLRSERYKFDQKPVDENCKCECCSTVSRAYLRHLIRIKEPAGQRLATIHNLTFYKEWMRMLRDII